MQRVVEVEKKRVRVNIEDRVTVDHSIDPIKVVENSRSGQVRALVPETFPIRVAGPTERVQISQDGDELVKLSCVGPQGPRGETGPPGTANDQSYTVTGALSSLKAVVANSSGLVGADLIDITNGDQVVGISLNATGTSGGEVTVRSIGSLQDPSFNWTPGLPIYVGQDGILTQSPPNIANQTWQKIIGHAIASDEIFVTLGPTIFTC